MYYAIDLICACVNRRKKEACEGGSKKRRVKEATVTGVRVHTYVRTSVLYHYLQILTAFRLARLACKATYKQWPQALVMRYWDCDLSLVYGLDVYVCLLLIVYCLLFFQREDQSPSHDTSLPPLKIRQEFTGDRGKDNPRKRSEYKNRKFLTEKKLTPYSLCMLPRAYKEKRACNCYLSNSKWAGACVLK